MIASLLARPRQPQWPLAWLALVLGCGSATATDDGSSSDEGTSTTGLTPSDESSGGATSQGLDSSDSGSSGDSGSDDGSTTDTGSGPPGFVPAFVAQGHLGRTMLSCDDGMTWIADRSADDTVRCFENGFDCDHNEWSGTGLTAGDGVLVTTWGWGTEGRIQRSEDGVEWTDVQTGPTFSGTAYGNETFLAGARVPWRGSSDGASWTELPDSGLTEWTPRGIGFAPVDGGRFVIGGGGGGTSDLVVSSDDGDSWWHPDSFPPLCGDSIRGIAYGAGAIVIARSTLDGADLCVSLDAGQTFTAIDTDQALQTPPLWTGDALVVYGHDTRYRSTDGMRWTAEPLSSPVSLGAIDRSPDGTWVAHRDGWLVWYEQQELYRSVDGLSWEPLAAGAFTGGHPLRFIRHAWVRPHADGCT